MNQLEWRPGLVIRVALKDLLGRKLRLVLTSLAIVMGVAMVSGTFVLTDTINAGFNAIFTTAYSSGRRGRHRQGRLRQRTQDAPSFPESTARPGRTPPGRGGRGRRRSVDQAQFVGRNGKVVASGGAPGLAFSVNSGGDQRFNPLTLVSGTLALGPARGGDRRAHGREERTSRVGDLVAVIPRAGKEQRFRISGIVTLRERRPRSAARRSRSSTCRPRRSSSTRSASSTRSTRPPSRDVSNQALSPRSRPSCRPTRRCYTGEQQAKQSAEQITSALSFLKYFLLAFGGIALFVGAFVIANTLSITIAQRTREFATLRDDRGDRAPGPPGRHRSRVSSSGTLASIVGLFVGLALAKGLDALFKSARGRPAADRARVRLAHGDRLARPRRSIVTLLASLRPALRATRVPPIAAVREGSVLPPLRFARFGPVVAVVVCALAIALVVLRGVRQRVDDRPAPRRPRRRCLRPLHRRRDRRPEPRPAARLDSRAGRRRWSAGWPESSRVRTPCATRAGPPRPRPR